MASATSSQDSPNGAPLLAQALGGLVKFKDIKPLWPTAAATPEFALPFYKYCDSAQPNIARGVPPAVLSQELRLITGVCQPGQGMPLHNHTGEELMFAASGTWVIYFDEAESAKVHLDRWDAIVVPGGVTRGWRNIGRDTGCLLNISAITDQMTMTRPAKGEKAPSP
ncbi:cupin domain-containing protein [Caulobacter sp. KR2-114]|uniref:cupin domain-containing protein n=1 Tax=Caulobacter sp. KR2-114 TaxID=3400912 RepID=UPI003C114E4A